VNDQAKLGKRYTIRVTQRADQEIGSYYDALFSGRSYENDRSDSVQFTLRVQSSLTTIEESVFTDMLSIINQEQLNKLSGTPSFDPPLDSDQTFLIDFSLAGTEGWESGLPGTIDPFIQMAVDLGILDV